MVRAVGPISFLLRMKRTEVQGWETKEQVSSSIFQVVNWLGSPPPLNRVETVAQSCLGRGIRGRHRRRNCSGCPQKKEDAGMSAGASQLSKLFLVSDALLRADSRLIKTKNNYQVRPPGESPLLDSFSPWSLRPERLQEAAPLSAVPLPSQRGQAQGLPWLQLRRPRRPRRRRNLSPTFQGLRPRPFPGPKHVPRPALPDHTAARL